LLRFDADYPAAYRIQTFVGLGEVQNKAQKKQIKQKNKAKKKCKKVRFLHF